MEQFSETEFLKAQLPAIPGQAVMHSQWTLLSGSAEFIVFNAYEHHSSSSPIS